MKKLISILLCLLLLLTVFVGCNEKKPTGTPTEKPTETPTETPSDTVSKKLPDEVIYDGELYKIERIDGKCYVIIKNYVHKETPEFGCPFATSVSFSSFSEFKKALLFDGLSEKQLNELKKCSWVDENGRIEIFEVRNLRLPKLPVGAKLTGIDWYGISFVYRITAGDSVFWMRYTSEDSYKNSYKSYITDSTDAYTISGNGAKYEVNLRVRETASTPYTYNMFSSNDGVFLHIMFSSNILIAEEWLLQLGY